MKAGHYYTYLRFLLGANLLWPQQLLRLRLSRIKTEKAVCDPNFYLFRCSKKL